MWLLIDKMVMVRALTGVLQVPSAVRLESHYAIVPGLHYTNIEETLCARMQMQ